MNTINQPIINTGALFTDWVKHLVSAAQLAPSPLNSQPWRFSWDGSTLKIFLTVESPSSTQAQNSVSAWMSLGAALVNIEVAALHDGFSTEKFFFSQGETNGAAGVAIRFDKFSQGPMAGFQAAHPLYEALTMRVTNRRPYRTAPLPLEVQTALLSVPNAMDGIAVQWVESRNELEALTLAAAVAESTFLHNHSMHSEFFNAIAWNKNSAWRRGTGISVEALEPSLIGRAALRILSYWPVARLAVRLGAAKWIVRRKFQTLRRCAAMGVIWSNASHPHAAVQAGKALQHLWLTAAKNGLAFQCFGSLAPVVKTIRRIFPSMEGWQPMCVFRVGEAPAVAPRSPRRPLNEIFHVTDANLKTTTQGESQ